MGVKRWHHWLYLNEAAAKEYGFTHEGVFFGVPAWMTSPDGDTFFACPKVTLLQLWCRLLDAVLETATLFISEDTELVTPVTVIRKLP